MNRKMLAIAAALAAASSTSFAIEAEQTPLPQSSMQTRDEVKAEIREWRDAGALGADEREVSPDALDARDRDSALGVHSSEQRIERGLPNDAREPLQMPSERMAVQPGAVTSPSNEALAPQKADVFQHPSVPRTN